MFSSFGRAASNPVKIGQCLGKGKVHLDIRVTCPEEMIKDNLQPRQRGEVRQGF